MLVVGIISLLNFNLMVSLYMELPIMVYSPFKVGIQKFAGRLRDCSLELITTLVHNCVMWVRLM